MKIRLKDSDSLRLLILQKGYSQRSFSLAVGVTSAYMSTVLRGERNVSPSLAKRVSDFLGVPFDSIFFVEGVLNHVRSQEGGMMNEASAL